MSSPNPGEVYFRQAAKLRWCLHQNIDDHDHARSGGRIVYLMDANILRFFINPERDKKHVMAFGQGGSDDYAVGTALVTAEYLFSRELPGQGASPALIAPAHGDDMQDVILGMQRGFETGGAPDDSTDYIPNISLRDLVRKVQNERIERDDAIQQLRNLVPNIARRVLEGGYQEVSQLLRLYNNDLLRPLALHPAATRDVLDLDSEAKSLAKKWQERIRKERLARFKGDSGSRRLIERDAEVLMQVMMLDAAAVADGNSTRYVLLTADSALFDAYTRWFWEDRYSEAPQARFLLRIPLQYAPILNVQDMPNGISRSDIIQRARDALDGLFVNTPALRDSYPDKLVYYRILAKSKDFDNNTIKSFYGYDPLKFDTSAIEVFQNARHIWRESFRNGVVLNAELMQRRLREEFGALARLLREDTDLLKALHKDQQRIMSDILAAHASITTKINLASLINYKTGGNRIQRAPLILKKRFYGIIGEVHLDDALNRLVLEDTLIVPGMEEALNEAPLWEAFFFAACVAHRCSHWQAAKLYSGWAASNLPEELATSTDRLELAYLQASSARYEFASLDSIGEAFLNLQSMISKCSDNVDNFGKSRALSEACSMMLMSLYRAHLTSDEVATAFVETFNHFLPLMGGWLSRAQQAAMECDLFEGGGQNLKLHADFNLISAEVYCHFFPSRNLLITQPEKDRVLSAVTYAGKWLRHADAPAVLNLEYNMARLALGQSSVTEAAALMKTAIREFEKSAGDRPITDDQELIYFRHIFKNQYDIDI